MPSQHPDRTEQRVPGDAGGRGRRRPVGGGMLYAPVRRVPDGGAEVLLGEDHPGFRDPAYRRRRNEIARRSLDWEPGDPVPVIDYTDVEHEVWSTCVGELRRLHRRHACAEFRAASEALDLPTGRIPQLTEVTERLAPLSGFCYLPVAGLAPLGEFYGSFADRVFWSTQYLRHPSDPRYTPEPDIVHEIIGHATQLAIPGVAEVYEAVGRAARRLETVDGLRFLSRVFWFTFEFGVLDTPGGPRAWGAGILSSIGETAAFATTAEIRPLDVRAMATATYDITRFQPVLYATRTLGEALGVLAELFDDLDDDTVGRILGVDPDRSPPVPEPRSTP